MTIESIVRPFQTPDASPARPFYPGAKAAPPNVIVQAGRRGGGRTLSGSASSSASFYMTQYVNEKADADWGTVF